MTKWVFSTALFLLSAAALADVISKETPVLRWSLPGKLRQHQ